MSQVQELDVVRTRRQVVGENQTWPAGSEGTAVSTNIPAVLVEFTDRASPDVATALSDMA